MELTNQPDRITLDPSRLFNDILAGHAELQRQQAADMAAYVQALKDHDWSHEFSDDFRVWQAGSRQLDALYAMRVRLDPDYSVWNQHCHPACTNGRRYF